jgi:hypothetical protein
MESDDVHQIGLQLHQLLLGGDPTAFARIAELYLEPLKLALTRRFPNLDDPHLIETAIEDALLNYWSHPEKYDPKKRRLVGYFYMSACGDLLNYLSRNKAELTKIEIVELSDIEQEYLIEDESGSYDIEKVITGELPIIARIQDLLDNPVDMELLLLMVLDVRETYEFARVLKVTDQPFKEQQRIVKQNKDRIKKMIQRHIDPKELIQ